MDGDKIVKNEKLDRRKKYTRRVLKESLLELLKEKPFSAVTVKEICELADVNRSTFYAHYRDQFDLLETIENEIIEDMEEYLHQYNLQKKEDAVRMTEKLIEYFAAKHEELKILLHVQSESSFEEKVMEVAYHFLTSEWTVHEHLDENFSAYSSAFIISGSVEVLKMWLSSGMKESPRLMAELINQLINHGVYGNNWKEEN